jgi:magnesium-transporting ATPase (P-type)
MFGRKKNNTVMTIFIDGLDAILDVQQTVSTVWQQRHAPSNMGTILTKSINASDDPLDIALASYIHAHTMSMPLYEPFHRIMFNRQTGISGNVWHHGNEYHATIKGAPEHILENCDLSENERESLTAQLHAMSSTGEAVIAIASGILPHPIKTVDTLKKNEKLSFVGFVGLRLTVSSSAQQLLAKAKQANITTYVATGQHQETACYVTGQLGIAVTPADVLDAQRLGVLNSDEIRKAILSINVFSRCTPERKKHIFSAIKAIDKSVATVTTFDDLQKLLAK